MCEVSADARGWTSARTQNDVALSGLLLAVSVCGCVLLLCCSLVSPVFALHSLPLSWSSCRVVLLSLTHLRGCSVSPRRRLHGHMIIIPFFILQIGLQQLQTIQEQIVALARTGRASIGPYAPFANMRGLLNFLSLPQTPSYEMLHALLGMELTALFDGVAPSVNVGGTVDHALPVVHVPAPIGSQREGVLRFAALRQSQEGEGERMGGWGRGEQRRAHTNKEQQSTHRMSTQKSKRKARERPSQRRVVRSLRCAALRCPCRVRLTFPSPSLIHPPLIPPLSVGSILLFHPTTGQYL